MDKFIFIDESGVHLGMTRGYGRALSHERAVSFSPFNKGTRVTMIAAIGVNKIKTATFGDWHVDGNIFLGFIQECLVPVLESGQYVFLDNLSTHKVVGVREAIEAVGAKLIYLPPYSPDLNPIELCWSKIKNYLQKKAARTFEQLQQVMSEAFKSVNSSDLENWFEHCGYCYQ
jgi:transposase